MKSKEQKIYDDLLRYINLNRIRGCLKDSEGYIYVRNLENYIYKKQIKLDKNKNKNEKY